MRTLTTMVALLIALALATACSQPEATGTTTPTLSAPTTESGTATPEKPDSTVPSTTGPTQKNKPVQRGPDATEAPRTPTHEPADEPEPSPTPPANKHAPDPATPTREAESISTKPYAEDAHRERADPHPTAIASASADAGAASADHIKGGSVEEPAEAFTHAAPSLHGGRGEPPGRHPRRHRPADLQAGEIDDNEQWQQYLEFLKEKAPYDKQQIPQTERFVISVTGPEGRPAHNVLVIFEDTAGQDLATVRTHADGRAVHHLEGPEGPQRAEEITIVAYESPNNSVRQTLEGSQQGTTINLKLPEVPHRREPLEQDVLFLLDSTGSMTDEINQIKKTLVSISDQVQDLPGNPDLRMAMVSYRDRRDEYVTRLYDFDPNARHFANTVRSVQADGGGDYPEALSEALHVGKPTWRDQAVKLVFLIADAPPQQYDNQIDHLTETAYAQEKGIKIFAVASSGLDTEGELAFRHIAQRTMGKFIFLLYRSGPQGELKTPHDVGDDFTVEALDRLVVRLITAEIQHTETGSRGNNR